MEKVLLNKIIKICDLFNVSRYVLPKPEEMQYNINILRNEILEKEKFLDEMDKSLVSFFEYRIGDVINIFLTNILGNRTRKVRLVSLLL